MSAEKKPIMVIIIGGPVGIGPEITVATMTDKSVYDECKPFLIGPVPIISRAMKIMGCDFVIHKITHPQEARFSWGTLGVLETGDYDCDSIEWGKVQKPVGQMSLDYVMRSIELGKAGLINMVSIAPIHEEAIKLMGCRLSGHTEIYQVETQSDYGLAMFHIHNLRVFFVSRYMALKVAYDYANKAWVLVYVQQTHHEFTALNISNPRIAVAALNPHGSDNGSFGHEEADNLIPAVKATQEMGINATGLVPADSVSHLGKQGRYDAILSLYHDQGHVACKTLDSERSITITFGLSPMRSSVDHGTASDIVGIGKAGTVSMLESTLVVVRYWRMKYQQLPRFAQITRTEKWKNAC